MYSGYPNLPSSPSAHKYESSHQSPLPFLVQLNSEEGSLQLLSINQVAQGIEIPPDDLMGMETPSAADK